MSQHSPSFFTMETKHTPVMKASYPASCARPPPFRLWLVWPSSTVNSGGLNLLQRSLYRLPREVMGMSTLKKLFVHRGILANY